jgi:hypothetical protein
LFSLRHDDTTEDRVMVEFSAGAGTWEKHPKYGRQIKMDHVASEMPQDAEGRA